MDVLRDRDLLKKPYNLLFKVADRDVWLMASVVWASLTAVVIRVMVAMAVDFLFGGHGATALSAADHSCIGKFMGFRAFFDFPSSVTVPPLPYW